MRYICALTTILIVVIMGLYKLSIIPFKTNIEKEETFTAIIESSSAEKNYYNLYTIIKDKKKYILYVKKEVQKFEIGDIVKINAQYNETSHQRNFNGFDYNIYLRSKNIRGIFQAEKINKIGESKSIKVQSIKFFSIIRENISKTYQKKLSKGNAALLIGLTVGDKTYIEDEVVEYFRNSSLSHVLAISGAHLSYIILGILILTRKLKNKRLSQFLTIIGIMFFVLLTGMSPSVLRAGLMSIIPIIASILKRKNDFYTTMCFSILLQMILNPFVIFDIGFILSYSGVLGIVLFYNTILEKTKLKITSLTLSANLILFPIMAYNFNKFSFAFIFSNFVASIVLGPIIIIGYLSTIFRFKIIYIILDLLCSILIKSAEFFSNIKILRVNIVSPSIISIIIYYVILISLALKIKKTKMQQDSFNEKDILVNKDCISTKQKKIYLKKIIAILIIIQIVSNINFITFDTNNLYINFLDVGQGDSCLIRYKNYNIMIDSGGSEKNTKYDVGKNVLMRCLLSKKVKKLDYIIISHFDADHCQGFIYLLKNFKIKNAIICKQPENSKLYEEFLKISKEKHVNIFYAKRGDCIHISQIKILILNPISLNKEEFIQENAMNNNAIVCKIIFFNFSILFTGDIEKEAEKEIVETYKFSRILKTDILKIPHHGSKTSSTNELLDLADPKLALIGVGVNNKFGHPNEETIEKLTKRKIKIYRTDLMGEIYLKVNKNGKIKVKTKILSSEK